MEYSLCVDERSWKQNRFLSDDISYLLYITIFFDCLLVILIKFILYLKEELTAVRKLHHEQLETAEEAREAAELRAVEIQKQQEQR